MKKTIAFIFARGGSKGLPLKNQLKLLDHPLIAYSIYIAKINPLEKDNIHAIEMAIKFIENERLDIKEIEKVSDE